MTIMTQHGQLQHFWNISSGQHLDTTTSQSTRLERGVRGRLSRLAATVLVLVQLIWRGAWLKASIRNFIVNFTASQPNTVAPNALS
eukprot:6303373-Amphidinium_carterae.2